VHASNEIILIAGLLSVLAVLAGYASSRLGNPILLALIAVGMLAGEDGPGGIPFSNFHAAYLIGSLALATILFEGGLNTPYAMIRAALRPAIALATLGVALSAALVGAAAVLLLGLPWTLALLLGVATAPTDAAAVSSLLRASRLRLPTRVAAALELESGLNDPMSVFLTLLLVERLTTPHGLHAGAALLLLAREMGGGILVGVAGGLALTAALRRLRMDAAAAPVLALGSALAIFGGAQLAGASGFLATYLAGLLVANRPHPAADALTRFFDAMGWLAQSTLFLMLGLLVTPHELPRHLVPALVVSAILVLLARPASVLACVLPFRWRVNEAAFVSWAGLRGGVPIYLTIIPLLAEVRQGYALFQVVFIVVIVSVAIQGWTVRPVARLLAIEDGTAPD
jgi:potassium/hydrogen antiporter